MSHSLNMSTQNAKNERLEKCRVYRVAYTVVGRNGKRFTRIQACVVAMDVADLADDIRRIVLGTEITNTNENGQIDFHEVVEAVEIESAELIGRLHGVTNTAHQIIRKCDDHENVDPAG